MKIESYGASDIGLSRLNNEDVWAQLPGEQFFILADGMGGHKAGEVAASEAVIELCKLIKRERKIQRSNLEWQTVLREGIFDANLHVHRLATTDRSREGMGTTICMALILSHNIIIAHVGDSRIYRLRKGRLTLLTQDHSLKGELIASGELDESLAGSFPYKNVITRAIGTQSTIKPEIQSLEIESNDLYLLCSDGLTDPLSDNQIEEILEEAPSPKTASENLILAAKHAGGGDNITLVVIKTSY